MTEIVAQYKSLLHQMTQSTPTCLWNDSCSLQELAYATEHGAVGATCNPVIVVEVLKKEMHALARAHPAARRRDADGDRAGHRLAARRGDVGEGRGTAAAGVRRAARTATAGCRSRPIRGYYRDANAIVQQAVRFAGLAPNIIVKIPVTTAGVAAIEKATYRGISINATVCFSLPQCVAVAEAVERGLQRREAEGLDIRSIGPVCTIMVGRLDDWLKVVAEKRDISVDPGVLEWAGVAVFKKTYQLFQQRGYRIRLLSAAFRNHMHWSEFIGGDVVISPPHKWQVRFNASDVAVEPRIASRWHPAIVVGAHGSRTSGAPTTRTVCPSRSSTISRRRGARCVSSSPPATTSRRRSAT